MVGIGRPSRGILLRLVTPRCPTFTRAASEELNERARTACLNDFVLLVRFARVFALHRLNDIDLTSSGRKCPCILSAYPEENNFRGVAEIEANATSIGAAVFSDFMPDDVAFVLKSPRCHHAQPFGKERIRNPKVQVGRFDTDTSNRKVTNCVEGHCVITVEALMFWRNLPRLILELPRWVGQDGMKSLRPNFSKEIV